MGIEKDGYLPPRDAVFDEIIKTCGEVWVKLTPEKEQMSYRLSKLHFLSFLKNEGADCMFALAQFHPILRYNIIKNLSVEAKDFINYYEQVNENQRSSTENNSR